MHQIVNYSKDRPFNVVLRSNLVNDYTRYDFESCWTALKVFQNLVDSDLDGVFWNIQLRYKTKCLKSYSNFKNAFV